MHSVMVEMFYILWETFFYFLKNKLRPYSKAQKIEENV